MINDKTLQFSDGQALTASAASTNYIDLKSDRDVGPGTPLWLVIVSKAAPGGTTPTIAPSIQTDAADDFGTVKTLVSLPAIAGANFGVGKQVVIPWPYENERYSRVYFTLAGTSPTFTVDAFLTSYPPPNWQAYPDAL